MATSTLSSAAQFQYMVQWFEEWSDFQRNDFLPILAEKLSSNGLYVNGLVDGMNTVNCQDKPMSLFQCRVKLFNDWYANWNAEDRNNLVKRLSEIDETFGVKLQEELSGNKQVVNSDELYSNNLNITEEVESVNIPINNGHTESIEVENQEVINDIE